MNSEFGGLQLRFSGISEWTSSITGVSWFLVIKIRSPHSRLCLLGELNDRDGGRVSQPAVQETAHTRSQKWQEGGHSCQMQSKKRDGRSGFGSTSLLRRLAAEHEPLSIVLGTRGASPVALLQRRRRRVTFSFVNVAVFHSWRLICKQHHLWNRNSECLTKKKKTFNAKFSARACFACEGIIKITLSESLSVQMCETRRGRALASGQITS